MCVCVRVCVCVCERERVPSLYCQVGEIPEDMEEMKFKEVEKRFLRQFNMPPEEKLVNC